MVLAAGSFEYFTTEIVAGPEIFEIFGRDLPSDRLLVEVEFILDVVIAVSINSVECAVEVSSDEVIGVEG